MGRLPTIFALPKSQRWSWPNLEIFSDSLMGWVWLKETTNSLIQAHPQYSNGFNQWISSHFKLLGGHQSQIKPARPKNAMTLQPSGPRSTRSRVDKPWVLPQFANTRIVTLDKGPKKTHRILSLDNRTTCLSWVNNILTHIKTRAVQLLYSWPRNPSVTVPGSLHPRSNLDPVGLFVVHDLQCCT